MKITTLHKLILFNAVLVGIIIVAIGVIAGWVMAVATVLGGAFLVLSILVVGRYHGHWL